MIMNRLKKIIEYGLYLLVFLLPVQTRWMIKAGELNQGYWEYGTISLYAADILLIILLLSFAIYKLKNYRLRIIKSKTLQLQEPNATKMNMGVNKIAGCGLQIANYWWLIAGLDLIIFISIFFATDKVLAFYGYAKFLLAIGLFWLTVSAGYSYTKLLYSLLSGIFIQASLGIWQFLTQSGFANKWLGLALHRAEDLGTSVIETISSLDGVPERWLRAYGGMDHPNVLGGLLVVGILLIIFLIISVSNNKKFLISKPQIPNSKFQIINYIILLIFFTSLLFTYSRGAWLGFVLGIIIMLLVFIIQKKLLEQKILLEMILILSIIFFIIFNQYQDLFITRITNETRLENKSNMERLESYQNSWYLIKNNWLIGVGINNYTLVENNQIIKDQPSWYYQPVHNTFLLILTEIGIIGFLFFMSLIFYLYYQLIKQKKIFKIAILSSIIIMMLFDHWWWSLHFGILFLWLIIGLIIARNYKKCVEKDV